MNVKSRPMLRGATVALLLAALVPATAAGTDVGGPSEGSMAAENTRLVLRPVCTSGDLHRFAVVNEAGPATRFTVEVASTTVEPLTVAPGDTVRFWVPAGQADPVEITWPDGSASATPAANACAPETDVPAAAPASEPAPPQQPVDPGPPSPAGADDQTRPDDPAAPPAPVPPSSDPSADPAPEPEPDAADPDVPPAAAPAPEGRDAREPPAAAPEAGVSAGGRTTPRPQPSGSELACPDSWVAVDGDGDGTIDGADECELVVEAGAGGRPSGAMFTTAALIVTLGLLIASVAAGALSRRHMSSRGR